MENVAEYDSTIFKYKPAAIARAENNGIFIAQNLKPIAYRVYAVQDKNDNQIYEPGSDQVGFLEGTYNPREQPDFAMWYDSIRQYVVAEPQLYLRMFTDKAFRRQVLSQSERPLQHKAMLYFAAAHPQIERIRFDSIPEDRVIFDPQTVGRDTIALWFNMPSSALPDTIKGEITYFKHDTVNVLQSVTEPLKLAWRFIETKEQEKEREKLERDRRKGVRPHLQGNVAGYRWSATSLEGARQRRQAVHIRTYTLRAEYDSLRRAGGIDRSGRIPDGLWHPLPHDARYLLDGIEVPGRVFQFIDGLILRSLDIRTDSATIDGRPLVVGRTYADRAPLVEIDGMPSDVGEWLRMCRANVFSLEAEVPMYYYYLLPVEAVETFGRRGRFGAVCIEPAR